MQTGYIAQGLGSIELALRIGVGNQVEALVVQSVQILTVAIAIDALVIEREFAGNVGDTRELYRPPQYRTVALGHQVAVREAAQQTRGPYVVVTAVPAILDIEGYIGHALVDGGVVVAVERAGDRRSLGRQGHLPVFTHIERVAHHHVAHAGHAGRPLVVDGRRCRSGIDKGAPRLTYQETASLHIGLVETEAVVLPRPEVTVDEDRVFAQHRVVAHQLEEEVRRGGIHLELVAFGRIAGHGNIVGEEVAIGHGSVEVV